MKQSTFTLSLSAGGQPLPNQPVSLDIGGQQVAGMTNGSGLASLSLSLVIRPGDYVAQARFAGNTGYLSSTAASPFRVNKENTTLSLTPASATVLADQPTPFVASLSDSLGRPLGGRSVFFVVHNSTTTYAIAVITDVQGNAALRSLPLPDGVYTVDVYFNGTIPITSSSSITLSDDYYKKERSHMKRRGQQPRPISTVS